MRIDLCSVGRGGMDGVANPIVSLKKIEYGFGYIIIRSPYTLYSLYLRGTITPYPSTLEWIAKDPKPKALNPEPYIRRLEPRIRSP